MWKTWVRQDTPGRISVTKFSKKGGYPLKADSLDVTLAKPLPRRDTKGKESLGKKNKRK